MRRGRHTRSNLYPRYWPMLLIAAIAGLIVWVITYGPAATVVIPLAGDVIDWLAQQ